MAEGRGERSTGAMILIRDRNVEYRNTRSDVGLCFFATGMDRYAVVDLRQSTVYAASKDVWVEVGVEG